MQIPTYRKIIYLITAPLLILVWCVFHPKQFWEQAKKEWWDKNGLS